MSVFSQLPYQCRVEWGLRGARSAAERGDIIIIVDVLSFSSTTVAALHYGAEISPFKPPLNTEAQQYADHLKGELMLGRAEAAKARGPLYLQLRLTLQMQENGSYLFL